MKNIDNYRGCLIGGAVGDALGYAVEFLPDELIFQKYGERGITEYELIDGVAQISDDTQMTMYTANGLLLGTTMNLIQHAMQPYPHYIGRCYMDWLKSQSIKRTGHQPAECSWLNNVAEMNHRRAPGNTCLSALLYNNLGSVAVPRNDSKGCGGVMRVAPIGLYFDGTQFSADEIDMIGAEAAALTHGHELGYIPAAMLVHIINLLSHRSDFTVLDAVIDAKHAMRRLFAEAEHLDEMMTLTDKAISLASEKDIDELDAIRELGEGWAAEETLAIAIYCAIRYENDFERALIAAVNHSGDSDSTGAVTGNILGAHLGMKAIPNKFLTDLELRDTILELADDLFSYCGFNLDKGIKDPVWEAKYVHHSYPTNNDYAQ